MKLPFINKSTQTSCHTTSTQVEDGLSKVMLVGSPNTGKSLLFNSLTGIYTSVSNYPGTTVEVARGKIKVGGESFEVLDTPGMYSLMPVTEEEDVTRQILMDKKAKVVIHIVDAKNLDRMLPLTLQLIEAGVPIILVLNMMDEAKNRGIDYDVKRLSEILGISVFKTVAISGEGLSQLKDAICMVKEVEEDESFRIIDYGEIIETAIAQIKPVIRDYHISRRSLALLLLQGDKKIRKLIEEDLEKVDIQRINKILEGVKNNLNHPVRYVSAIKTQSTANRIVSEIFEEQSERSSANIGERVSLLLTRPLTGIPILLLVIYFGLYQFVGVFGAGTLVDYLESTVFEGSINPYVISLVNTYIPWEIIQDLVVGEYGVFTLGLRYAIAIILPIVSTFFFVFAIIEDTGYLPRMSMLIDRVFKKIGLSGRAVIPMTLGFGCGTMATMVTRTLETRRERIIATMLLALAIPCSAQLGVILGILSTSWQATLIWSGVILATLLFIGLLTAIIMPGEKPTFYMEIPPLRLPRISNVLSKTYARMEWYFIEILPIFLLASVLIWIGRETGVFQVVISGLTPLVSTLGLPDEAAVAFLFGFFRRDYGAAGLFDLQQSGVLSIEALVVSSVTLTLFVPCIAQFSIMMKERGTRTALAIAAFIFPFAFLIGYLVHLTFGGII